MTIKNNTGRSQNRADLYLIVFSITYLALPSFIFALGWMKFALAAMVVLFLILLGTSLIKDLRRVFVTDQLPTSFKAAAVVSIVVAVIWTGLSGAGGFGYQNGDYLKHNSVLFDLYRKAWPVFYEQNINPALLSSAQTPLVYYIAYYLPATAAAKAVGLHLLGPLQFLWTVVGIALSLLWFSRLVDSGGGFSRWAPLVFPSFGGLDFIATYLVNERMPILGEHVQWWGRIFQYTANTTLLWWVPQHAISGWLAAAAIVYCYRTGAALKYIFLWLSLVILWSPFSTIGILPFIAVICYRHGLKPMVSWQNFLSLLMGIPFGLFIISNRLQIPHGWIFEKPDFSLIWLSCFYLSSFGIYAVYSHYVLKRWSESDRKLWVLVLLALLAWPLYVFGSRHDLAMRGSIPTLFVFWVFVMRAAFSRRSQTGSRPAWLIMWLTLGTLTGGSELWRNLRYFNIGLPDPSAVSLMPNLDPQEDAKQYLGEDQSLFFRLIAK